MHHDEASQRMSVATVRSPRRDQEAIGSNVLDEPRNEPVADQCVRVEEAQVVGALVQSAPAACIVGRALVEKRSPRYVLDDDLRARCGVRKLVPQPLAALVRAREIDEAISNEWTSDQPRCRLTQEMEPSHTRHDYEDPRRPAVVRHPTTSILASAPLAQRVNH